MPSQTKNDASVAAAAAWVGEGAACARGHMGPFSAERHLGSPLGHDAEPSCAIIIMLQRQQWCWREQWVPQLDLSPGEVAGEGAAKPRLLLAPQGRVAAAALGSSGARVS